MQYYTNVSVLNFYIFLFLFLRKNAGISKSPCEEFTSDAGIELDFFSQDDFPIKLSTVDAVRDSGFSNPVAITVI